jgi:hypothetical protein
MTEPLRTEMRLVRLGDLELLPAERNARFMRESTFAALVENIRADGGLTSVPFAAVQESGRLRVLSGNHRVAAAVVALGADAEAWVMVTDSPLTDSRALAVQLAHNAIEGEDDPIRLALLYRELDDIDWRRYSGLDDATLGILDRLDVDSLAEPALEYHTLGLVFLPHDLEDVRKVMDEALAVLGRCEERIVAEYAQYHRLVGALDVASAAHNIVNRATVLQVILDVFADHVTDLADGWFPEHTTRSVQSKNTVPLETIFGTNRVPQDVARVVKQAVDRLVGRGDVGTSERWRALEVLAAEYLASP